MPSTAHTTVYRSSAAHVKAAEAVFRRDHRRYAVTDVIDELRRSDFARLDRGDHVHVDYTGGGLYAESQLDEHGL